MQIATPILFAIPVTKCAFVIIRERWIWKLGKYVMTGGYRAGYALQIT